MCESTKTTNVCQFHDSDYTCKQASFNVESKFGKVLFTYVYMTPTNSNLVEKAMPVASLWCDFLEKVDGGLLFEQTVMTKFGKIITKKPHELSESYLVGKLTAFVNEDDHVESTKLLREIECYLLTDENRTLDLSYPTIYN